MSDSRLEKFIYAICSMDVSDLPVPLSRIEKLWNCLITGETPDFEPLSRNEKYLMAMLDRYDISNLPAPMSRGEKLLYKIAVGETDLSDVPGYLSRYEELLKYLIENGEISEDDFEYVLYTLNQSLSTLYLTAEKPVKCAILTGQTLVNVNSKYTNNDFTVLDGIIDSDGWITITANGNYLNANARMNNLIKPNTKYLAIIEIKENTLNGAFMPFSQWGEETCFTTSFQDMNNDNSWFINAKAKGVFKSFLTTKDKVDIATATILERSYVDITCTTGLITYRVMLIEYQQGMENWDIPFFRGMQSVKMPVLTTSNEGGTKSNILMVNEDVTLRGIVDVQDELNLLTGEVTERIGEVILDGSQSMDADGRGIYIQVNDMKKVEDYRTIITCDKLPVFYHQWDLPNVENGITGYCDEGNIYPGQNWLYIKVNNSINVDEVIQILSQNPITVQYQLATESIKTVDLTVVDQDNQPTELGTFENVTHVSLVAENLIPEVEMEVATYISEELASASPLMDDISTKQEQLNTMVDEQSENVDATMIATTEIFEEIL